MLIAWDSFCPPICQETILTWDILSALHCNLMTSHWQLSHFLHFRVLYQIQSCISLGKCGMHNVHVLQLHLFGPQNVVFFT